MKVPKGVSFTPKAKQKKIESIILANLNQVNNSIWS